eukprot:1306696-Amphidinium_carterae.1
MKVVLNDLIALCLKPLSKRLRFKRFQAIGFLCSGVELWNGDGRTASLSSQLSAALAAGASLGRQSSSLSDSRAPFVRVSDNQLTYDWEDNNVGFRIPEVAIICRASWRIQFYNVTCSWVARSLSSKNASPTLCWSHCRAYLTDCCTQMLRIAAQPRTGPSAVGHTIHCREQIGSNDSTLWASIAEMNNDH